MASRAGVGDLLTAMLGVIGVEQALAQSEYPMRSIRLVVPNSAGGTADTVGRGLAQGLSERLGRQVVVDNRPGAGTIIGTEMVARASPDGFNWATADVLTSRDFAAAVKLPPSTAQVRYW